MIYDQQSFTDAIQSKAKVLEIHPKLLIYATVSLAADAKSTEQKVFKPFFSAFVRDMKESAEEQLKSNNRGLREAGESALNPLEKHIVDTVNSPLFKETRLEMLMPEGEKALKLHYVAWDILWTERKKIVEKYSKQANSLDCIQIIKFLCPDLIEKAKQVIHLFDIDFSQN